MVDFPKDESLMTAGLDAWPKSLEDCPLEWRVTEERLQERLGTTHFRLPPDFREPGRGVENANIHIPFVRFPSWHYCPRCSTMVLLSVFDLGQIRCASMSCTKLPERRRPFLVPVRIVAVCSHGHIEDFPFQTWAHSSQSSSATDMPVQGHTLEFRAGSVATLAGIKIHCSCGAKRSLSGAFNFDPQTGGALDKLGHRCRGLRPWLGETDGDPGRCSEPLRVVQRGASNVYFPQILSSIYLPLWGENTNAKVVKALENPRIWQTLTDGLEEGKYVVAETCRVVASIRGVDSEELRIAAQRKLNGEQQEAKSTEEDFRRSEYEAFRKCRGSSETDLLVEPTRIDSYGENLSRFIGSVRLVRKLRETRVLAGFTRLLPPGESNESSHLQRLSLDRMIRWLPCIIVRGEGIFLELREELITEWAKDSSLARRVASLVDSYNAGRRQRGLPDRTIAPKFVLLHTFAHLLIKQLSLDCGYGSASLRERIYFEESEGKPSMHGVLIYTASGDSEGTMGGLVKKGEPGNLEPTLWKAIEAARWCSSDPVCIESKGQGTDSANLAACHSCALLPETSCEEGNRLLDRAIVVGSPYAPDLGYFHRQPT